MNETVITVVGNVASDPSLRVTTNGVRVVGFRLASTERRYDRNLGGWRDGETTFYTVNCWRNVGENALDSVAKGQPVLVQGRLRTRSYEKDGQSRTSLEIEASSLGHDISRGVSRFTRASVSLDRPEFASDVESDEPLGAPSDEARRDDAVDADAGDAGDAVDAVDAVDVGAEGTSSPSAA